MIHKVFVSSTYEDLREERSEVQKALLRIGALPVAMELFPSADDETWDFVQRQIDDSDYYIVIVAGRYGHTLSDGISFTEREYDYARAVGKRPLSFLHADPGKILVERTDQDSEKLQKLEAFRAKLRQYPVTTFLSTHELASQVITSFVSHRERHPKVGFVRADELVEFKKYAQVLEENVELKEQLTRLSADTQPFESADKTISLQAEVGGGNTKEVSLKDLFIAVSKIMLMGNTSEFHVNVELRKHFFAGVGVQTLDQSELFKIKERLFALNLVEFGLDSQWSLTDFGRKQYKLLVLGEP